MTITTRQAIIEMRKRGHDGLEIINMARVAQQFEKTFMNANVSLATALVQYVKESPNIRRCVNCGGTHHIQNCGEIKFWLNASNASFNKFMEENGL
jgi:hypothetical protein